MEKINFPQTVSQSDQLNPYRPGATQLNYFDLTGSLEEEYSKRL